jgi:hypothetical protein
MSDDDLLAYLGLDADLPPAPENAERRAKLAASLRPKYAAFAETCLSIEMWDKGLGPLPPGVIVCKPRGRHGR